jgi:hypothetical protein
VPEALEGYRAQAACLGIGMPGERHDPFAVPSALWPTTKYWPRASVT